MAGTAQVRGNRASLEFLQLPCGGFTIIAPNICSKSVCCVGLAAGRYFIARSPAGCHRGWWHMPAIARPSACSRCERRGNATFCRGCMPAGLVAAGCRNKCAPQTSNPALVRPTTRGAVQLAALSTHAWGRPALSERGQVSIPPEGREGGASIQALQFDAGGELLVAASDEGVLSVHSTQQLMQALARCVGLGGAAAAPGMYLSS